MRYDMTLLNDNDLYLFNGGDHVRLYERLGAHTVQKDDLTGVYFAVWAPDADGVSVVGDFNDWDRSRHPLQPRGQSGIWEGFLPEVKRGARYKYFVRSRYHGYKVEKADPFAFYNEVPPRTASIVWDHDYLWNDVQWMDQRKASNMFEAPMSIYEVHLGSWMRVPEEENRPLTYRETAPRLTEHIQRMGFTHVEFLPVMEHPFYGSWGYQVSGYFSPTSRYGTPQDLMFLIDYLHQHDIGVILDWVPSHFPGDEYALGYFDGTYLYEHQDPRKRIHPDWDSLIFNYGRNEVRSFLLSSALFWLDVFHADGLRVDAVASMLYLDYSRRDGEWAPNVHGGRENLEAISFLRRFNEEVFKDRPGVQTVAEESTDWPMVSRPTYVGGLGFGMKWDMGWMHDTLVYMTKDPIHRSYHHNQLTFRQLYAWHENFVLPLSHDEVVHGKGSLLGKMPGDDWQKFANLRLLYGYMYAQSGKKLLFMGGEFGQWNEWYHETSLDWNLLEYPIHASLARWVADINHVYRNEPAMHQLDFDPAGFEWIDCNDAHSSVLSFIRNGKSPDDAIVIVCNFTPIPRRGYRVGVPCAGYWKEILNSDAEIYGGSGVGNAGGVMSVDDPIHGRDCHIKLVLPPLGVLFFKKSGGQP